MSWQLRAMTVALRAYGFVKRGAGTAESMQADIERSRAKPPKIPPSAKAVRGLEVSDASIGGVTVYELRPPSNPSGRHVLYLHGGSYTFEISPFHRHVHRRLRHLLRGPAADALRG